MLIMKIKYLLWGLSVFFIFWCNASFSQSYGLAFYSHEVVQDQRTGLDLSPGKTLCFDNDFELSFDLTFLPARKDYFGYIVRFVDSNNENIDLIYDKDPHEKNHFRLIMGDRFSKIAFNIPQNVLFSSWNTIKFKFDYARKILRVSYGSFSSETSLMVKKNDCFKILFGANEYQGFKTTDVPPMKIRNIHIAEDGTEKFSWQLDEYDGIVAREMLHGKNGAVVKPRWIKKLHYEWELLQSAVVDGAASVAFDAKNEIVHVVAADSLLSYEVRSGRVDHIAYLSGKQNMLRGNQSVFDPQHNQLLNFYMDQKIVSAFNPESKSWSSNFDLNTPITDFWQFNKFYSVGDTSLYMVGGYGHFFYKNVIQRYHFPARKWEKVDVSGDAIIPRYLAALGSTGNGAYILGGYGSSTGQQLLNPRNLYDLLYFDVKKRTIKKIYELPVKEEHFVFANSLVINEKEGTYYGLIFPKHKFKSHLQLIEGSLTKPEFKLMGSLIPYTFHDINSFADLFYCAESKRFIAVTLFWDENNRTKVEIYALNSPPIGVNAEVVLPSEMNYGYMIVGLLLLLGIAGFFIYSRKQQQKPAEQPVLPVVLKDLSPESKSGIFLFGDMQVFDKDGQEITRQFTPLIKELFLVILLYTIRWERGISSEKLKELLWFDKSEESARNNRSVNIAKLKNILEKIDNCSVSKETGYWRFNCDFENTYVDYYHYFSIIKEKKKLNKEKILALAALIKRGSFLPNANYEWMDHFKAEISNEIIDTYLHFTHSVSIADDPELLIELANYIFYFDSVNEEAMTIKCKALAYMGKHSQSKNTYESFCKEYRLLYNDDFDKSFNTVLSTEPSV
ncbi:Kelch repeat protein [Pedobacter heparinus DSM 2366]|uniref:Kelch repeat protein n=2 Tax=Pedobacter heparinus TaxID=984 RepID=C6XSK0_PEDHD|nr:Kelch repeat protein [Pedobacter heparinus DSM 2366]